nr:MAG TPA: hypothetical protein [Caudoviricetes sp.]
MWGIAHPLAENAHPNIKSAHPTDLSLKGIGRENAKGSTVTISESP